MKLHEALFYSKLDLRPGTRSVSFLVLALAPILAGSCRTTPRAVVREPRIEIPKPEPQPRQTFEGAASFYGEEFAGRPTANGETYDPSKLTAAHRRLPFGTNVRVTSKESQKSVVVRINDRGPAKNSRVLDLSLAAAKQLGMVENGVVEVIAEVMNNEERGEE